jgi:hypothetical protein
VTWLSQYICFLASVYRLIDSLESPRYEIVTANASFMVRGLLELPVRVRRRGPA